MIRRSRLVLLAATVYVIALILIATWPTHVDKNVNVLNGPPGTWLMDVGVSSDVTYRLIEASVNVVLFLPFGVLLMLASLRMTWLRATAVALAVSASIEILQGLALPGRTADAVDVASNALGATLGALGVTLGRLAVQRASRRTESPVG